MYGSNCDPFWPSAPFWPLICPDGKHFALFVKDWCDLPIYFCLVELRLVFLVVLNPPLVS